MKQKIHENSKKSPAIEQARICNLQTQLSILITKLNMIEKKQLAGDYSDETARLGGIIQHKIEVVQNRMSGVFEFGNKHIIEVSIPKFK
jgi:hypothetical protein